MIGQSFSIIAVILVMAAMFRRAGRSMGAVSCLPLISVSLFHLIGAAVYKFLVASEFPTHTLYCVIDIAGFVVGVAACWFIARAITSKRLRYVYFYSCGIFLIGLAVAYIRYLL